MRRAAALVASLALSGWAGCAGDDANDGGQAGPPETGRSEARSEVRTGGPRVTSSVAIGAGGLVSSIETRVGETLTELEATETSEGTVITLPEQVLFEFGSAELRPAAEETLARIAEVVGFYAAPVTIRGHTDSVGSEESNQDLSERRAEAVRADLAARPLIGPDRLKAVGLGESQPVAPNAGPDGADNPVGREQNRRVEIVVQGVRR